MSDHNNNNYVWDYPSAAALGKRFGHPPTPTITTFNPRFEEWIERAATALCLAANECGVIPTPCTSHIQKARDCAYWLLTRLTHGRQFDA